MSGDRLHGAHGDGKEVVPGVLRGYRYFDINMGLLTSIGYNHVWHGDSWHTAKCPYRLISAASCDACEYCAKSVIGQRSPSNVPGYQDSFVVKMPCLHPHESWFSEEEEIDTQHQIFREMYKATMRRTVSIKVETTKYHDDVPRLDCSCGFYASYTYDHLLLAQQSGATSEGILGVVEASGKIVLGTRGFRAEKMRILALSGDNHIGTFVGGSIPVYNVIDTMLEKYPPDDVSHLVEVEPVLDEVNQLKVELNRLTSTNIHLKRFAATYLNGNWNVGKNVGKSYHVPPNSTAALVTDQSKLWQDLMNIMKGKD